MVTCVREGKVSGTKLYISDKYEDLTVKKFTVDDSIALNTHGGGS